LKEVLVLGGGESGVGAALSAKHFNYEVFLSDAGLISQNYKTILNQAAIPFEENGHNIANQYNGDIVVKSPGIPDNALIIVSLKNKGKEVISEIEWAFRFCDSSIIGITGSNGKTTTSSLLHYILVSAGIDVGLAGNIGKSFAEQVAFAEHRNYVLELSSFQLDGIVRFQPHIAILLNISPDHLDRYDNDYQKYVSSKFRIAENQSNADYLIYDADDETILDYMAINKDKIKSNLLPFSLTKKLLEGASLNKSVIEINMNQEKTTMEIQKLALQGKHNVKNIMAAAMAAKLMKVRNESLYESLSDFEGVEHRLENFVKIHGVSYINDSKATNVNATFYALECMENPTVWIVGGVDKGNDYMELLPLVREKVKAIICLGVDNKKIADTFEAVVPFFIETAGAEEAAKVAYKLATKGDNVLLSPACASFDLFENYEDRGRQFKNAVRQL
jgi:UDP-N-acetylmuramoylalanine--D-glutamate ligase